MGWDSGKDDAWHSSWPPPLVQVHAERWRHSLRQRPDMHRLKIKLVFSSHWKRPYQWGYARFFRKGNPGIKARLMIQSPQGLCEPKDSADLKQAVQLETGLKKAVAKITKHWSCHLLSPSAPSKWACNCLCSMTFGICQRKAILIFPVHLWFQPCLIGRVLAFFPTGKKKFIKEQEADGKIGTLPLAGRRQSMKYSKKLFNTLGQPSMTSEPPSVCSFRERGWKFLLGLRGNDPNW